MKTRKELIEARVLAIAAMKAASATENFDQVVYDKSKKDVDSFTAQIGTFDIEAKLEKEIDPVLDIQDSKQKPEAKAQMSALLTYARTGAIDAQNSVTIGGASNGIVLIPEQYATSILTDLKSASAMRKFATVIKTNGTFNMPIGGGTPNFDWIEEGGSYPKPNLSFTNKTLAAFKAGGIILVSEELLNDSSFGLEKYLKEQIVEGIAVKEGAAYINADGTGKPKGISLDVKAELTEILSALDIITIADIEDVYLAVPSQARKEGDWIISDKLFRAIFRMKDATGNYILREGPNGTPGTIFGRPYEIEDAMEGGADEPLAVFGKLKDYVIGDRGEMAIQRLDQTYAEDGYVGFKVYKRTDGKLSRNKYVSQLKNAAS